MNFLPSYRTLWDADRSIPILGGQALKLDVAFASLIKRFWLAEYFSHEFYEVLPALGHFTLF